MTDEQAAAEILDLARPGKRERTDAQRIRALEQEAALLRAQVTEQGAILAALVAEGRIPPARAIEREWFRDNEEVA